MIEVDVTDVLTKVLPAKGGSPRLVNDRLRIVLLRERGGDRVLPIWIGPEEADSLALQLGGEALPRPLTADLMARIVEATGARVERVEISSLRERTFYGVVRLETSSGARDIDARPSDALNLAARTGAPIFVDSGVLDESGRSAGEVPACLDEEQYAVIGAADEGEWRSVSPEFARALREPPKPAP